MPKSRRSRNMMSSTPYDATSSPPDLPTQYTRFGDDDPPSENLVSRFDGFFPEDDNDYMLPVCTSNMPDASAGHDMLKEMLMQPSQLPGYPGSVFTWNPVSAQSEAGAPTVVESGDVDSRTVAENPTPPPTPTPASSRPTDKSHRKTQTSTEAPAKPQSKTQERASVAQSSTVPRTEQRPLPCPLPTPPPEELSQAPSGKSVRASRKYRKPAKSSGITVVLPPTLPMINSDQQPFSTRPRPTEPEAQPIASSSKAGTKHRGSRRRASSSPRAIEASSSAIRGDDPSSRASGAGNTSPADQQSDLPGETADPQDAPEVRATRGRVPIIPVPDYQRPTSCGAYCCTGKGEVITFPKHLPNEPPFCKFCFDEQGRFLAFPGRNESYDHLHDKHCNVSAGQNVIQLGEQMVFKCPWCGITTECCSNTAKKHCAVHMEVKVPCPLCSRWLSNISSLSQHAKGVHGVQIPEAGKSQAKQPKAKRPQAKQSEARQFDVEEPEMYEDALCEARYDAQRHNQGKKRKRDDDDSDYVPEGRRKRRA